MPSLAESRLNEGAPRRVASRTFPIGGFWVFFLEGNAGDRHVYGSPVPVPRAEAAHKEIQIAGRKRVVKMPAGAKPFEVINPGNNSDARPDLVAGTYVAECLDDGMKCVGVCGNREDGAPFDYEWIDVAPGEMYTVRRGAVVALGGDYLLDINQPRLGLSYFQALTRQVTFTATTRVLGVAIWVA